MRQLNAEQEALRSIDSVGEIIRQVRMQQEALRSINPVGEIMRQVRAQQEALRSINPVGEIMRQVRMQQEALRSINPVGEIMRQVRMQQEALRSINPIGEIIRQVRAQQEATLRGVSARPIDPFWASDTAAALAERFVGDAAFGQELLTRLREFDVHDTVDPADVSDEDVLRAVQQALDDSGISDRTADSEAIVDRLVRWFSGLPPLVQQAAMQLLIGVIVAIFQVVITPATHGVGYEVGKLLRDSRSVAARVAADLGADRNAFRIVKIGKLPVYAYHRLDAPRTASLDIAECVQVIGKHKNWCEITWIDATGCERGGWVQTRYLRRL